MPATSRHKHPHGYEIVFDEGPHEYYTLLPGGVSPHGVALRELADPSKGAEPPLSRHLYTSGTAFVHSFCPPFDPDGAIAERKARERGVSVEQIRFEWRQKGAEACETGTRIHETCEDALRGRAFRNAPRDEHERLLMAAGWEACRRIMSGCDILGVEQIVGDLDCQIAGTIDLLVRDRATGGVVICDWKTNAKVDFRNDYREGSRLLEPVSHLHNCSGELYTLQLNLYQYLLVRGGYLPRETRFGRRIIHLTEGGPTFYDLPDRQIEIRDMLIRRMESYTF